jgi:hypothetical protein
MQIKNIFLAILIVVFLTGCVCEEEIRRRRTSDFSEITEKIPSSPDTPEAMRYTQTEKESFIRDYERYLRRKEKEREKELSLQAENIEDALSEKEEEIIETENLSLAKKEVPLWIEEETIEKEKEGKKAKEEITSPEELAYFKAWNGECLVYDIKWNFMSAGKSMIVCKEEENSYGSVYHLIGLTLPDGLIEKMGYGYNRFDSFIDRETLKPYYFYSYTKTGNKERTVEVYFDWEAKNYRWVMKKFEGEKCYGQKEETVNFKGNIYDGVTVFYVIRTLNMEEKDNFKIPVAIKDVWDLIINVKGKEIKKLQHLGKKKVFVIHPEAKSDEGFFQKGKMDVWITADKLRLPVYFEGKVPFGTGTMSLLSVIKINPKENFGRESIGRVLQKINR